MNTFEQAYTRWPDDAKLRSLLASAHYALGTELLDGGKNDLAVTELRRASELAPGDIEAQMNLGRALHNALHHSEALKSFNQVIAGNSSTPLLRFHLGMTFYALGDFDKAIADLTQEIETNPAYPPARLLRGLAYIANADWERANADLTIASTAMTGNANAHYGYARTLVHMSKLSEAEVALKKAMEADPTDPALTCSASGDGRSHPRVLELSPRYACGAPKAAAAAHDRTGVSPVARSPRRRTEV